FSSRRRHTRCLSDWSSDVCSSDLDIGVVQTIGRADAQLDFVHAHVEKLLQFHVLFAYSGGRLIELDHVFVEIDEDIEVMPQNSRSEERRVGKEGRLRQWREP